MLHPYLIMEWEGSRFRTGASEGIGPMGGADWVGSPEVWQYPSLPTREGGAERRTERVCLNINLPRDIKFSSCWIFKVQQDLL